MPGKATELVFHEDFHPDTVAAINELREIRLVSMLALRANIEKTTQQIGGEEGDSKAIQSDIEEKIRVLRDRLANPGRIYADELELYLDLLANPEA